MLLVVVVLVLLVTWGSMSVNSWCTGLTLEGEYVVAFTYLPGEVMSVVVVV